MADFLNVFYVLLPVIAVYWLIKYLRTVRLQGPPSPSFVFGHTKEIAGSPSPADLYDSWAEKYGRIYQVRGPMGTGRLVLCDPKAIAHVYALDSWKYCHTPLARRQLSSLTGPNSLLTTVGENHSRQRKILTPMYGPSALKRYSSVMYDSAYKVFTAWESELQASTTNEIMVDVSEWINHLSFDIIGLAAFSHDFKSLDGEHSTVSTALTALGHSRPSPRVQKILLMSQAYPILLKLPLPRSAIIAELSNAMDEIVDGLTRSAKEGSAPQSALGVLLNAKELSPTQVRVHAKSTLFAGFATTSSTTKWALIELSMHPEKQDRLRAELSSFTTIDPSYEELTNGLPYLDAIVRETLRLHPVLSESTRVALEDDVLPLSKQIRTVSGTLIDKVPIRKGTELTTSILYTNLSKTIWGEDATEFKPERWLNDLEGVPASAKEYPGYHHIMTFLEGPKQCLGMRFAVLELKIVLSVLIRKFLFIPKYGKDTKYEKAFFLGPHPKVAGEPGGQVPICVKRVE
ncbi:cytochrome P450 [Mycena rosella]|uniref:Cytochrome P450 n=1 Tax=Mycena rosella TaxID=1033263 RepID=A0AAD7GVR2_MYCRO|nr:cytochrome P450 [Mycena rosella]